MNRRDYWAMLACYLLTAALALAALYIGGWRP